MFYTIYQTTNLVNNKVYIGAHKTNHLDDDYLGSGKHLVRAIKKYGIENFKKETLFVFDNAEEMYRKEKELVNESFVSSSDTYNMKVGGFGGWDHVDNTNKIVTETTKKIMSERAKIRQLGDTNSFYGKRHTEEAKIKIGKSSKERASELYNKRMLDGNHPNSNGSCPHCGKIGQLRAMKRWHFDKCKLKI